MVPEGGGIGMSSDIIGMIAGLVVLLAMSAFFSASETAFSSLNVIRLRSWAEDGDEKAKRALSLHEDYDQLLSAILIGNNIVNIAAATIGTLLFTRFYPVYGATVSTGVITLLVLIFSEVTPKSLAKARPERLAMAVAPVVKLLMTLLRPLTALFRLWTDSIQRLSKDEEDTGITGDELITMVAEAEQEGGLDEDESELIRSAIEFGNRIAEEILIPRVDVVAVDDTASVEEVIDTFLSSDFSRLLVCHENMDHVLGYIHIHDVYRLHRDSRTDWLSALTPVVYASHNEQIYDLLQSLQKEKAHMAVVVDEYGGTMGIVTMEDILEELVGEIWDEHDEVVEEIKQQEDGSWLVACSADLNDVFRLFDLKPEDAEASTVSGWVVEELGHVPEQGDTFQYENLKVTVTEVDKLRVVEIKVELLPEDGKDE